MKVDNTKLLILTPEKELTSALNDSDIQWFSAKFKENPKEIAVPINNEIDIVSKGIYSSISSRNDFDKTINKVVKTRDPLDLLSVSRSMSDYYMQTMLSTKVISKGIQCVEKLTSLQ